MTTRTKRISVRRTVDEGTTAIHRGTDAASPVVTGNAGTPPVPTPTPALARTLEFVRRGPSVRSSPP